MNTRVKSRSQLTKLLKRLTSSRRSKQRSTRPPSLSTHLMPKPRSCSNKSRPQRQLRRQPKRQRPRIAITVLAAARAVAGQAAAVAPAVAAVTLAAAPMSPPMVLLSTTPCRASAAHMCGAPKVRTPSTALDLCAGHICKLAFPFRTKARRFTTAHHGAGLFLKLARAMFSGAAGTWESR